MQADDLIPQLFDEWAASYARGERPDPRLFLARAGDRRDELSALMERFLQAAPRPQPTDEDVELVQAWMRGDSPLAEIRSRRGITRDQIVTAIQERFGLRDDQRAAIKDYYHQLESGLISPRRLSARLVQFLSETFGVGACGDHRLRAAPHRRTRSVSRRSFGRRDVPRRCRTGDRVTDRIRFRSEGPLPFERVRVHNQSVSARVTDDRAHALRARYARRFGDPGFPLPVESIAEDLLGLDVQRVPMVCSGMLLPAERRILVNADEAPVRQRFTIAHELGHWICQCLEGSVGEAPTSTAGPPT